MKSLNFAILFAIILIFDNFKQVESQQQRRRKGSYVAGRNNMPVYADGQMPRIEKVKVQEKQKFQSTQEQVHKGTTYKDYLFTVQGVEEFLINLPVTQQVAINMFGYIIFDGAYLTPSNIDNDSPIKVYVYQNNNRLIHHSDFYFQNFIVFQGQQLSTYTIRFINSGSERLVAMSLKKLTENTHVQELVDKNIAQTHAVKADQLFQDLKFLFTTFERYTIINFQSVKTLLKEISFYFYWHMIETLVAVMICLLQVFSIGKICKSQPIV